jgi:hypothetical protein
LTLLDWCEARTGTIADFVRHRVHPPRMGDRSEIAPDLTSRSVEIRVHPCPECSADYQNGHFHAPWMRRAAMGYCSENCERPRSIGVGITIAVGIVSCEGCPQIGIGLIHR